MSKTKIQLDSASSLSAFGGASALIELVGTTGDSAFLLDPPSDSAREPLTYDALHELVAKTRSSLGTFSTLTSKGAAARVGAVLPACAPELATLFLSVSSFASFAPLNPDATTAEFSSTMELLHVDVCVTLASNMKVKAAAEALGIPVIELTPSSTVVGDFELNAVAGDVACATVTKDTVALAVLTSGSTAKPKVVALTHENLGCGALAIASTLQLDPAVDVGVNMMPLFHLHGLMVNVLVVAIAGASVVCEAGLRADAFEKLILDANVTWYSAVPPIHDAIITTLEASPSWASARDTTKLRLARHDSAALLPVLAARMEAVFGPRVVVIATYAMSECIPICSNAVGADATRYHLEGGVGPGAGAEVNLWDISAGALLDASLTGPDNEGEVVVKGPQCITAYEGDDEATAKANASAFVGDGWMRTGDRAWRNADGAIFLVGRNKEIINRGGEKVSPFEVEDALAAAPEVADLIAFAMPHAVLGETVGLLVVAADAGAPPTLGGLRAYAKDSGVLSAAKWPEFLQIVTSIPKTPSGKPKRIGVAKDLGLTAIGASFHDAGDAPDRSTIELAEEVLMLDTVSPDDDLFDLGLNSVSVMWLAKKTGLSSPALYSLRTAAKIDAAIASGDDGEDPILSKIDGWGTYIVQVKPDASTPGGVSTSGVLGDGTEPLFIVPDFSGTPAWAYKHILKNLKTKRRIVALYDQALFGKESKPFRDLNEMASDMLVNIRAIQPTGPYFFITYSAGCSRALLMADQISAVDGPNQIGYIGMCETLPVWGAMNFFTMTNSFMFNFFLMPPNPLTSFMWHQIYMKKNHPANEATKTNPFNVAPREGAAMAKAYKTVKMMTGGVSKCLGIHWQCTFQQLLFTRTQPSEGPMVVEMPFTREELIDVATQAKKAKKSTEETCALIHDFTMEKLAGALPGSNIAMLNAVMQHSFTDFFCPAFTFTPTVMHANFDFTNKVEFYFPDRSHFKWMADVASYWKTFGENVSVKTVQLSDRAKAASLTLRQVGCDPFGGPKKPAGENDIIHLLPVNDEQWSAETAANIDVRLGTSEW